MQIQRCVTAAVGNNRVGRIIRSVQDQIRTSRTLREERFTLARIFCANSSNNRIDHVHIHIPAPVFGPSNELHTFRL
jgi:hypothetical protein